MKNNAKTIFLITTGRSGSTYLTNLFSTVRNVVSMHEPDREVDYLRRINRDNDIPLAEKFVKDVKIPIIEQRMNNKKGGVYIETSHLICKGYLETLIQEYPDSKIIYLTRDIKNTAKAVEHCLKDGGKFIFEVHYLANLIDELQWDNIYHEHIYYYSVTALNNMLKNYGMSIVDYDLISIKSGILASPSVVNKFLMNASIRIV